MFSKGYKQNLSFPVFALHVGCLTLAETANKAEKGKLQFWF